MPYPESSSQETPARMTPPFSLILFGATGDLAKRKLFPALYSLYLDKLLPDNFAIIGVARRPYNDETFRTELQHAILHFSRDPIDDPDDWEAFASHFYYTSVDVSKAEDFDKLHGRLLEIETLHQLSQNRIFYLAMAPEFFGSVALNLRASQLTTATGWKRLIIEKPFGHDLASAELLNDQLRQVFEEDEIYRIDHYLGKEMVQNIEVIRFANSIFEPVWNNRAIANVQITSSETVGVEDRAPYYEKSGALRDMVQNHMLQMVMMIAMEPPSRLKTEAIRDEKVKVLRSLRRYQAEEVANHVIRAQYQTGEIYGQPAQGYRDEPNVSAGSLTETYVAARLYIDNFRWAGVPFYIRTGKRLAEKTTEIVIQFKDMPKNLYFNKSGNLGPNLLVIRVNPEEGMYILLNVKRPGNDEVVIPVAMEFSQTPDDSPEAYERLLYDALLGDSTYFTRWDEVSLAWKFVDPMARAFQDAMVPLHHYPAGALGPRAADELLASNHFHWWPVGKQTQHETPAMERKFGQSMED